MWWCCFQQKTYNISETGQDRTNYYWRSIWSRIRAFDCCQNQRPWMTLNGHYTLIFKIYAFLEPTTKIWMKIDLHYQRRRCILITLVSGNIRSIFAGVRWRRYVKRQFGCRQRQFPVLSTAISWEDLHVRLTLLYIYCLDPRRFFFRAVKIQQLQPIKLGL